MTLDLGDEAVADSTVTASLPANTAGTAGDAVTWDPGNDRVDATDANGENVVGILAEDAPGTAGDPASVHVSGLVVANVAAGVSHNDILLSSGTEGQLRANPDNTGHEVDVDGTTDQGLFAPANPQAFTDAGGSWPPQDGNSLGSNEAVVLLR